MSSEDFPKGSKAIIISIANCPARWGSHVPRADTNNKYLGTVVTVVGPPAGVDACACCVSVEPPSAHWATVPVRIPKKCLRRIDPQDDVVDVEAEVMP